MVGEAVADETQTTFFDVLLDGVEGLLFGNLHLSVGPTRNLNDHVQDPIVLVGEKRDVVEGRDYGAVGSLFDEDTVLCICVRRGQTLRMMFVLPRVLAAPIWRVVYSMKTMLRRR